MKLSTILLALTASIATAAPAGKSKNAFKVTDFVFGCTASCYYSFNLTVGPSSQNHPAVQTPVKCSGGLDSTTTYADCGRVSDTQILRAYIEKKTNLLYLQYQVNVPAQTAVYWYEGDKEVYSATGDQADKQKPNFKVPETRAYAIA